MRDYNVKLRPNLRQRRAENIINDAAQRRPHTHIQNANDMVVAKHFLIHTAPQNETTGGPNVFGAFNYVYIRAYKTQCAPRSPHEMGGSDYIYGIRGVRPADGINYIALGGLGIR